MPYEFHVRGNSAPGENAAVQTAFNNLITALRAATARRVDAGGSKLDAVTLAADEAIAADQTLPPGVTF